MIKDVNICLLELFFVPESLVKAISSWKFQSVFLYHLQKQNKKNLYFFASYKKEFSVFIKVYCIIRGVSIFPSGSQIYFKNVFLLLLVLCISHT